MLTLEPLVNEKEHPKEHSHSCYSSGCRHPICLKKHREYESERKRVRQGRRGNWLPPVKVKQAQERITVLKAHNIGLKTISLKTKISVSTLQKIKQGRVEWVRGTTMAKLMSVPTDYYVETEEARAHLLFLASQGIGIQRISQLTGIHRRTLGYIRAGMRQFTYKGNVDKILGLGTHMFNPNWRQLPTRERVNGGSIIKEYRKG